MITLEKITKSYPVKDSLFHALKPIDLTIHDGEILGILGYSGAGKSTLLRILNGLITPTSGKLYYDSKPFPFDDYVKRNEIRHSIGMIFQHFNLLSSYTVYQNLKLALSIYKYDSDIDTRIDELLDLVGLKEKKYSYPKALSGGEAQRVGIARALANHPKVLLCDEATSALDNQTANEIILLLKEIQKKTNVTIVFISHQIEMVKDLCDRIIIMHQGEIVEDRKTLDLFIHPKHPISQTLVNNYMGEIHPKTNYLLIYTESSVEHALISSCIKNYEVEINLLFGKTLSLKEITIGILQVQIEGKDTVKALDYLKENGLEVKHV